MSIVGKGRIAIQKFGTLEACQQRTFFTMQRSKINTYKDYTLYVKKKNEEQ